MTAEQKFEAMRAATEKLKRILAEKQMENVTFDVLPAGDLPLDPKSGKFRLIIPAG